MEKSVDVSGSIAGMLGPSNRYLNEKGCISLIHPCRTTMNLFEIYCIEGDLFDDIERFDSLDEAESAIRTYLGEAVESAKATLKKPVAE